MYIVVSAVIAFSLLVTTATGMLVCSSVGAVSGQIEVAERIGLIRLSASANLPQPRNQRLKLTATATRSYSI